MSWGARRKFLYVTAAAILALAALAYFGAQLFSRAPSCFDTVKNQNETGVDCGGPCSLFCAPQVHEPVVLWTRLFETSPGVYTAAAYIQNPNAASGAAAYGVKYAVRVFDSSNVLIVERDGTIDIPPQQVLPIVETAIGTGTRIPARAFLEFSGAISWKKIEKGVLPSVRVVNQSLSSDATNLTASLRNQSDSPVVNMSLAAVLFDAAGTAQGASKTLVPRIEPAASAPVVFTWPSALGGIVRAEITPVPALPR